MSRPMTLSLLALLVLTMVSAPVHAAEPRAPFAFTFGLGLGSDDNVLQLTQDGIDRLATRPGPPRYLIDSADDMVRSLDAGLEWRTRPWARHETRIAAGLDASWFAKDDVADHVTYDAALVQELTASRHALALAKLYTSYTPRYYLGEITDADASVIALRRVRNSLRFSEQVVGARLEQQFQRGRIVLQAGIERSHRDYDANFDERDGDDTRTRERAAWQPFKHWDATFAIVATQGTLKARGDLPQTDILDTDISYEHSGVGGEVVLPWGRGASRGRVAIAYQPETRRYTTSDKFDLRRFGRENARTEWSVRVTQHVHGTIDAIASGSRLASKASFPTGIVFPSSSTDFDQTRIGLELRGRWDVRRHKP